MMRAFPVSIVPQRPEDAVYVERGGQRKRCAIDRIWYADWHNVTRGRAAHHAQDIFAPQGSLVLAVEAGTVIRSTKATGPTSKGGHNVWLRSGDRIYYFAHLMDAPDVAAGDVVEGGQLLGRVGRTGNASTTCPHLHLQAWKKLPNGRRGASVNLYRELRALDPTVGGRLRSPSNQLTEAKEKPCRA